MTLAGMSLEQQIAAAAALRHLDQTFREPEASRTTSSFASGAIELIEAPDRAW